MVEKNVSTSAMGHRVRAISLRRICHHIDKSQYRAVTPWHTCILQYNLSCMNTA